jgi:O-antigen/teichoic acid export membrane protein
MLPMGLSYLASSGSLIASSAAQLITFAVLARSMGVEQFALFVSISAITTIAVQVCSLGTTECLVRRVAKDRSLYPDMLGHSLILTGLGSGALFVAGLVLLTPLIPLSQDPAANLAAMGLILFTNIVLVSAIVLAEHVFIAHSDFASANGSVVIFAFARTAAALLACFAFGVSTVADWAIWSFAAHALVLAVCIWMLRRLGRPRARIVREEVRLGLLFSAPILLRALRQNVDILVLSIVATSEVLGSYSLARRMLDSSYLSVGALHRLIYPGSAVAAADGIHLAMDRTMRVLAAVLGISILTATAVYLLAPLLPYLFGHEFTSLVSFTRILCWLLIILAVWSTALEGLGAAGHHGARALTIGIGSVVGGAIVAWAAWYDPPRGVFIATYLTEAGMAIATWLVLLRIVRSKRTIAAERAGIV